MTPDSGSFGSAALAKQEGGDALDPWLLLAVAAYITNIVGWFVWAFLKQFGGAL